MKNFLLLFVFIFTVTLFPISSFADAELTNDASKTLDKGIQYFYSVSTNGGYMSGYSLDLKKRRGFLRDVADTQIQVQTPGTPSVGEAFLKAYKVTGDKFYLLCAEKAGDALIWGQKNSGGWSRYIDFNNKAENESCKIWSITTTSALRFLMALNMVIQKKSLQAAVEKGLGFMLESQFENGAWPPFYPLLGDRYNCYTFNDGTINDCISTMLEAHKNYNKPEHLESIKKAGDFIYISQLPPPQPGWAQHYNYYLQPQWFRQYEPPSVNSSVTARNFSTLVDLFLYTGNKKYLEPIPDAIRWLKNSRLPNGRWARFYELRTNVPLYYDRDRIRVSAVEELSDERRTGYRYQVNIDLENITEYYNNVKKLGRDEYIKEKEKALSENEKIKKLKVLETTVRNIISSQDEMGRWVTKNRYRINVLGTGQWNGQYAVEDMIMSRIFIKNINLLCDYIEMAKSIY